MLKYCRAVWTTDCSSYLHGHTYSSHPQHLQTEAQILEVKLLTSVENRTALVILGLSSHIGLVYHGYNLQHLSLGGLKY